MIKDSSVKFKKQTVNSNSLPLKKLILCFGILLWQLIQMLLALINFLYTKQKWDGN